MLCVSSIPITHACLSHHGAKIIALVAQHGICDAVLDALQQSRSSKSGTSSGVVDMSVMAGPCKLACTLGGCAALLGHAVVGHATHTFDTAL